MFVSMLVPVQVDSGEMAQVTEQLAKLQVQSVKTVTVAPVDECALDDQPRVLSAALALARALPCEADELVIAGWKSTPEVSRLVSARVIIPACFCMHVTACLWALYLEIYPLLSGNASYTDQMHWVVCA